MEVYFCKDLSDEFVVLDPEDHKHVSRVLRMKEGDKLLLTNGKGMKATAEIIESSKTNTKLKVQETEQVPRSTPLLTMAIAPVKKPAKVELILEKLIELGADKLIWLNSSRAERVKLNMDRLNKIAISAIKQSRQYWLPEIIQMDHSELLSASSTYSNRYIAHCIEDMERSYLSGPVLEDTILLIGPEGDFTREEVAQAYEAGFQGVELSKNRLRTETAAIAACQTLKHLMHV